MKRISLILLVAIILAVIAMPFCFVKEAHAISTSTLWESKTAGGDTDSAHIYNVNMTSVEFTVGSTAHTVTSIKLDIKRTGNPGTLKCSIRNVVAGAPSGGDLTYGTTDGDIISTNYAWIIFTMVTEYSLEASTTYAIVLSAVTADAAGADFVEWYIDTSGATVLVDDSTDNGDTWVAYAGNSECLYQVWGNSVLSIIDLAVFQDYITTGSLLFCAYVNVNYPPYSATGVAKDYFQIQLLSVGGANVLGADPIVNWGYRPQSIYLSPTAAASITVGNAYQIRIQANYSAAVNTTQTLTSGDWLGNDLTKLDDWILNTAYAIQTQGGYSGTTALVTNVSGTGEILTDFGGAFFTPAIIGIAQQRPNIFVMAKSKPLFPTSTPNNVYDATDYRTLVGTPIANDLDTFGDLFSITGKNFAGWLIILGIAVVVLGGVILGGGAAAIPIFVVAGLPLLFIGNYLRLIGIQWTLVLAVIMLLLFIRQFYWKTT